MELAFVIMIIAAVVLLLQIVSLAQIAGIRKSLRTPKDGRPPQMQYGDQPEKKNQEFRRHERRPFPGPRPQQASPAAAPSDPVEKSLRDINMRLKSAEREQESARRKIQDNFSRGDQHRNRDVRDRNYRGNRDRDQNRPPRRDNWQDRNRSGGFQQTRQVQAVPPQPPHTEPFADNKATDIPSAPELSSPVIQQTAPATAQNNGVSDYSSGEDLQHGRKIIVKRRMLSDGVPEENSGESTSIEEAPPRVTEASATATDSSFPSKHTEEETRIGGTAPDGNLNGKIQFGRRYSK